MSDDAFGLALFASVATSKKPVTVKPKCKFIILPPTPLYNLCLDPLPYFLYLLPISTYHPTASSYSLSSAKWDFLKEDDLIQAIQMAELGTRLEPAIYDSLTPGSNAAAICKYRESIALAPTQVLAYYKLAMLLLRTAADTTTLTHCQGLLFQAHVNLEKYTQV